MIFGHVISWCSLNDSLFYIWLDRLLFCFMPWFFFKSGMFYKKRHIKEVVNRNSRLLKCFVIFGLIGLFTYYCRNYDNLSVNTIIKQPVATLLLSGTFCGNTALWFLLTLFLVKCLYSLLDLKLNHRAVLLIALILTIVILSFKTRFNLKYSEYMYNLMAGLLFYSAGVELKEYQFNKVVLYVAVIVFGAIYIMMPSRVDFQHTRLIEGSALLWPFASCAGIIIVNNVAKKTCCETCWMNRLLAYVGKNSMPFYVTHILIGNVAFIIMKVSGFINMVGGWSLFAVYAGVLLISLPLIGILFRTEYGLKLIR